MTDRLLIGDNAPNLILVNSAGERVALADIWSKGNTVITFLRHFGCLFCRDWLAELEQHHNDFIQAGLQMVSIGIGEPKHAARYCPKLSPSTICLVPEEGGDSAHRAYGLKNATGKEFANRDVGKVALKNVLKGNLGGIPTGNTQMMTGTFIVDTQGKIIYAYYSEHIADHPAIATLVAVQS